MTKVAFSEKIKILRQKKCWTQKELAKRTNLSNTYVSLLEKGTCKNLKFDTMKKIAEVLDVDVQELFSELF